MKLNILCGVPKILLGGFDTSGFVSELGGIGSFFANMLLLENNFCPFPLFVNSPIPFPFPNKLIFVKMFEVFDKDFPNKLFGYSLTYYFFYGYLFPNKGSTLSFFVVF